MRNNKTRFISLVTTIALIAVFVTTFKPSNLAIANTVATTQGSAIKINIFGEYINLQDTAPYIEDSRTMVPIRLISENLGFDVTWDGGTKEFSVKGVDVKDKEIVLIVGKMNQSEVVVSKGGTVTKKNIDESPKVVVTMKNDRLYVPLRFFSESFSLVVKYDGATRTVFISLPGDEPVSPDVVWNGNVNDFLNAIVDKTDMEKSKVSNQAQLNGTQLMVSDGSTAANGKGSKVEITASNWIYPQFFQPASMKKEAQETKDNVKQVVQMFTSDTTAWSKLDKAITNGDKTDFKTSDGKRITFEKGGSGLKIRFYE